MIHVVVGIVVNVQNEILVAERQSQKFQGGRWEFPGGKVEQGETPLQALQRELHEEIDIQVISAEPWQQLQHTFPDKVILLDVWQVTQFEGNPHGKEGQMIQWISIDQLSEINIPDANLPIVKSIQDKLVRN